MYHRQKNECYPLKLSDCQKNCSQNVMKTNLTVQSNKFDLCYYVQVNSLRLKWASEHLWE